MARRVRRRPRPRRASTAFRSSRRPSRPSPPTRTGGGASRTPAARTSRTPSSGTASEPCPPTWLALTRRLVRERRLDVVGGGWVSHDEALTPPQLVAAQYEEGLRTLERLLGARASERGGAADEPDEPDDSDEPDRLRDAWTRPRGGQIDPFGTRRARRDARVPSTPSFSTACPPRFARGWFAGASASSRDARSSAPSEAPSSRRPPAAL